MPSRILNKRDVPRGNYDFYVAETSTRLDSHVFAQLVQKVEQHMDANGVPIPPNLESYIEENFCSRRPEYCREDAEPHQSGEDMLTNIAASLAVPVADALAGLSKLFGINCKSCNHRHRIIRQIRRTGLTETLRQLKGTF